MVAIGTTGYHLATRSISKHAHESESLQLTTNSPQLLEKVGFFGSRSLRKRNAQSSYCLSQFSSLLDNVLVSAVVICFLNNFVCESLVKIFNRFSRVRSVRVQAQVPDLAFKKKQVADLVAFTIGGLRILCRFPSDAVCDS